MTLVTATGMTVNQSQKDLCPVLPQGLAGLHSLSETGASHLSTAAVLLHVFLSLSEECDGIYSDTHTHTHVHTHTHTYTHTHVHTYTHIHTHTHTHTCTHVHAHKPTYTHTADRPKTRKGI